MSTMRRCLKDKGEKGIYISQNPAGDSRTQDGELECEIQNSFITRIFTPHEN